MSLVHAIALLFTFLLVVLVEELNLMSGTIHWVFTICIVITMVYLAYMPRKEK